MTDKQTDRQTDRQTDMLLTATGISCTIESAPNSSGSDPERMYVCMYVCMYIMHIYIYIYIYIYIHIYRVDALMLFIRDSIYVCIHPNTIHSDHTFIYTLILYIQNDVYIQNDTFRMMTN